MATDIEQRPIVDRFGRLPLGAYERARANLTWSGRFITRRRHDVRFRVLPYDLLSLANGGALLVTALAALALAADPLTIVWRQNLPEPAIDFFRWVTRFGKSDWILISTGLFLILMLSLDAGMRAKRARARRMMRSLAAFYVFASVAIAGIVANLSKYVIGRARPKLFTDAGSFSFDFLSFEADWASFPSGHATTGMALGLSLALLFPRFRWVFLTLGFWIAVSRLFVGAHYPSDVLAGGLLGALTAWLLARALARHRLLFGFDRDGGLMRRRTASGRLA
jgi:undecaprenyl-diphosphatase